MPMHVIKKGVTPLLLLSLRPCLAIKFIKADEKIKFRGIKNKNSKDINNNSISSEGHICLKIAGSPRLINEKSK